MHSSLLYFSFVNSIPSRPVKESIADSTYHNWLYLIIPVFAMILILFICNMGRVYLKKRRIKMARNQYFQVRYTNEILNFRNFKILFFCCGTSSVTLFIYSQWKKRMLCRVVIGP